MFFSISRRIGVFCEILRFRYDVPVSFSGFVFRFLLYPDSMKNKTAYARTTADVGSQGHRMNRRLQVLDDVVDALGERHDIGRLDRREDADAQLVASELAVSAGIDDSVVAKRLDDLLGADCVIQIDGHGRGGPGGFVLDEGVCVFAAFRPLVQQRRGFRAGRGPMPARRCR